MAISPSEAVQAAQRGLRKIEDPGVAAAHVGGHAGIPLFVTRLDEPARDYYLVPWQQPRGIVMVVNVDASSGEVSSAVALAAPLPRLVMSPDEAKRAVEAQLHKPAAGEPVLVWRPSRESASPLQPLYRVPVAGGDVFVGVDGSVNCNLTPFGKGG